jgi:hypothetical protein
VIVRDHGCGAGGAWHDKSQTGPVTSPGMILKTFQSYSLKSLQDHGSTAGGGWQNKSPDPAGQAARLVIEQTADL